MKKLYQKNELSFALLWIGLYVVVMNIGMQVMGGMDGLAQKTLLQLAVPTALALVLAVWSTAWIVRNGLCKKYGLCRFEGKYSRFLYFVPLLLISLTNVKNGLGLSASLAQSLLMMAQMMLAAYVEEVIFRGFLFRAMEKSGLRPAIWVSGITFGAGHIVNLANTADTLGVLLQVCYAIAIGLLFTVIVYKGKSLWPVVVSHMLVNGSSVFARADGPFTTLMGGTAAAQVVSAVVLMVVSGAYALWLWKKA